MKRAHVLLALAPFAVLACTQTPSKSTSAPSASTPPAAQAPADPGLELGDPNLALRTPIAAGNLIVWPVVAKEASTPAQAVPAYLALDQALSSGAAEVLETREVNQLEIVNHSERPLLLLAGEVVAGGQQDRIVGRDLVIAPGARAPLASFCVEHGRWNSEAGDASGGTKFTAARTMAAAPVRYAAQVAKDQAEVWSSVGYLAAANQSSSPTGKYLAVVDNESVRKSVEERAAAVLGELADQRDAVGFVVAVDWGKESELVAAELFGGPELFGAFREKLVRAYCLDAITREKGPEIALAMQQAQGTQTVRAVGGGATARMSFGAPSTPGANSLGGSVQTLAEGSTDYELAADPDLVVDAARVEAGNVELKHLHRTIYKKKQE